MNFTLNDDNSEGASESQTDHARYTCRKWLKHVFICFE